MMVSYTELAVSSTSITKHRYKSAVMVALPIPSSSRDFTFPGRGYLTNTTSAFLYGSPMSCFNYLIPQYFYKINIGHGTFSRVIRIIHHRKTRLCGWAFTKGLPVVFNDIDGLNHPLPRIRTALLKGYHDGP